MTLIECRSADSFSVHTRGWSNASATTQTGAGIRGNRWCDSGTSITRQFPAGQALASDGQSVIWGFAHTLGVSGNFQVYSYDPTDSYLAFVVRCNGTAGTAQILDSTGAVIATSATTPWINQAADDWYYTEIKYEYESSTSCAIEVRVNGTVVVSATVTLPCNSNLLRKFAITGNGQSIKTMDYYWLNTGGSVNNTYIGDCRVEYLEATGVGANDGWALGAGASKTAAVTSHDVDVSYVRATATGIRQTFTLEDLASTSGTVKGVMVRGEARGENTARSVAPVVRTGGASYDGTADPVGTSTGYTPIEHVWDVNPGTSAAWTAAEINALEAGAVVTA